MNRFPQGCPAGQPHLRACAPPRRLWRLRLRPPLRLPLQLAWLLFALLLLGVSQPALAVREDLRVGVQLEPPGLDPSQTSSASAGEITYANVFEGLTIIDGEGRLQPRLALDWTPSQDGLSYLFRLRRNVVYHDGRAFDARSAAWSLRRIVAPDSVNPQRTWFGKVRAVEAEGPDRLRVRLSEPDALLPFALALPAAVMVHPDSATGNATHPVGTGPFRFDSWVPGSRVRLVRNDRHWGRRPALARAEFVFMHSSSETANMLSEGLVDGLLSVTRLGDRFVIRPDYRLSARKLESKLILAINNGRPPFDDLRVRRALSHAIDRQRMRTLYGPQFSPSLIGSHFPPSHPAYVDLVDRYPYDPARARLLLAEAGVPKGFEVELVVPPTDYGRYGGLMIASDLEAVGFRVELAEYDWARWMKDVFGERRYALTLIMHVEPMDLGIYAREGYYFGYDSAAFREIWRKVRAARSDQELHRWLGEAQRRVAEDAVNVFLFMRPEQNLMHRDLEGLWEKSRIPSFVLEDLRWSVKGATP